MRRPGRYQRATRFCGQASPPTSRMRSFGRSCSMVASSVGQQAMHGDVALAQEVGEFVADQRRARPRRNQRRARHQRHPDFLDREVEGDGHALIDAVARLIAVKLGGDAHEIADAGVRDGDALRVAGRARGVDDVAERIVRRRHAGQPARRACASIARLALSRKIFLTSSVARRSSKLDIETMAVISASPTMKRMRSIGKRGVERHVGGVDLHHRQHRDVGLGRLVEQQADAVAGLDALLDQVARHLVGAAVEFAIGERRRHR